MYHKIFQSLDGYPLKGFFYVKGSYKLEWKQNFKPVIICVVMFFVCLIPLFNDVALTLIYLFNLFIVIVMLNLVMNDLHI